MVCILIGNLSVSTMVPRIQLPEILNRIASCDARVKVYR